MVYAEVVLGVQVDWRTIPYQQINNVLLYGLNKFEMANSSAPLKTCPTPTTILLVFVRQP
jgi:hypothetical protein